MVDAHTGFASKLKLFLRYKFLLGWQETCNTKRYFFFCLRLWYSLNIILFIINLHLYKWWVHTHTLRTELNYFLKLRYIDKHFWIQETFNLSLSTLMLRVDAFVISLSLKINSYLHNCSCSIGVVSSRKAFQASSVTLKSIHHPIWLASHHKNVLWIETKRHRRKFSSCTFTIGWYSYCPFFLVREGIVEGDRRAFPLFTNCHQWSKKFSLTIKYFTLITGTCV